MGASRAHRAVEQGLRAAGARQGLVCLHYFAGRLAFCTALPYIYDMNVNSVRHKGLRKFLAKDSSRYLDQELVQRIRNIITVLVLAEDMDEFCRKAPPGWRVHELSGNRQNQWSISVSGNWRITFEERKGEVKHLNLEDYH